MISCYSTKCNKNKHGYCSSNIINVLGENAHSANETVCSDYESGNILKNTISNLNIFSGGASSNSAEVYCNANNCFYNRNGSCGAKNIKFKLNDVNEGSSCDTFVEAY